jgi:SAM-dependent methyltransferase
MVCHGELAKSRPHTAHLTQFYLIMSFAGMLGGMFNTFVAPFIFNAIYEYPIMIVAALLLRPNTSAGKMTLLQKWGMQSIFPAVVLICGLTIFAFTDHLGPYIDSIGVGLILLAGLTYTFRNKSVSLSLLTGIIIFFTMGLHSLLTSTLHQERTFFGVLSVRESTFINEQNQPEVFHEFYHGTTKHGAQRLVANQQRTPLTYFSRPGPIGQVFKVYMSVNQQWEIGVVGLGAGTLACYAQPEQNWTFYELDPTVVDIAENSEYFNYLRLCSKNLNMVVGDARLSLISEPDDKFDLLVIDAFSSDSIPTHLLTQEAMQLYFNKLKPNGLLAFHITNRHLALKKVISDHARKLDFDGLIQEYQPENKIPLIVATDWVVMAKNPEMLDPLRQTRLGNWQMLPIFFGVRSWTDDFTNIVNIWK